MVVKTVIITTTANDEEVKSCDCTYDGVLCENSAIYRMGCAEFYVSGSMEWKNSIYECFSAYSLHAG